MKLTMTITKIPMIARITLAVMTALFMSACQEDQQPAGPGPAVGDASALLPLSFYHIQDSDGGKAGAGVDVVLVFEPDGIADLYVARDAEAIAYKGTYAVKDGKIALKFNGDDLKADASFTIDTSQATVTMPFKAFSTTAGSSTWRKERKPIEHNLHVIFAAATLSENLRTDKAIARALNYANAMKAIGEAAQKRSLSAIPPQWRITDVKPLVNGVKIKYASGPYQNVQLFSWSTGTGVPLELSPLFGDPRLPLDPVPSRDGSSDPIEKTALFVSPFDGDRETVTWYDHHFVNRISATPSEPVHAGLAKAFELDAMSKKLQERGYRVKMLKDEEASLINMIESLLPGREGRSHSPGFIAVMTHGQSDGTLVTGTILGNSETWQESFKDVVAGLKARGYGDMLTYGGGTEESPATIEAVTLTQTMRPAFSGSSVYSIVVTPKFWEWLHTRQADFSRSLVFIGACLTDVTPDLRNAVRSRAYFAFDIAVYVGFAAKTLQYFCYGLWHPTHTAEETYYNLIRVMNTQQIIYHDDEILIRGLPKQIRDQGAEAMVFFKGYGYDGKEMVSYMSAGWLAADAVGADVGAIWWLLFSARWDRDAKAGADNMLNCWDSFWKKGTTGGLANPICHNKTPGRAPKQEEVAYASYLLTGKPILGVGGMKLIPRWTLNDGG